MGKKSLEELKEMMSSQGHILKKLISQHVNK